MHYAVRLNVKGTLDGTNGLKKGAIVERGAVIDITIKENFGVFDVTPIQAPPADKPLFLQSIGVHLKVEGVKGHVIEAYDPKGGPSFILLDLEKVQTRFDSTGWLLPVGYLLRLVGPACPLTETELNDPAVRGHILRFDFWQFDSIGQVLSKGTSGGAALPIGPAGGDLAGNYPNPYVKALHSNDTGLVIGEIGEGQLLTRSGSQITGVTPPATTVYGQNYAFVRQSATVASVSGTTNFADVLSYTLPFQVPVGEVYKLSWFLDLVVKSGSEWGLRLRNTTNNTNLFPVDSTYEYYRVRNTMDRWLIPHSGSMLVEPSQSTFTCALQICSPSSAQVSASGGLIEFYRVK